MALTGGTEPRVRRAAVNLFADKGFHGTGIRELAQAANLSSASLYHYMGTKEDLLAGIMRDALTRLLDAAGEIAGSTADPRARLAKLVALHVCTHALRPAETQVVDNEVRSLSEPARHEVVRLRDAYEEQWALAISDGMAAGRFVAGDPGVTRRALLEMCSGVARWYSPHGALSLDDLAAQYAALALRALGCVDRASGADLATAGEIVARVWGLPS
ncbi:TetR/AcrR family transcriptional regulator [Amycolatopsis minnesotensis]|uniref:TetR/AcrR family transcriptional regulator n=1 Tax=Amycolatopsis minnesotensis TaxID=337894 RepID=A0ABP5D2J1_9PSEU